MKQGEEASRATDTNAEDPEAVGRTHASGPRHRIQRETDPSRLEQPGDLLGSYELVELLGEGSMGRVFRAKHSTLGRQVAIKILRPEQYRNADLIQRFFREARTVNEINHEHIVEVIDFTQEPGPDGPSAVYFVMELLRGNSLGGLLKSGQVSLKRSLDIVGQLCEALAAAHKLGVVHRDVKPDNVFITERAGRSDYVKVLDFGVAKLTATTPEMSHVSTVEGAIVGTPICMAPEQAAGLDVDHRTDIWATGVILYELISGRLPFEGKTFGALAAQIIGQPPPPLPSSTPSGDRIPAKLQALVLRCLEKEASKRPQTMNELREGLAGFARVAAAPTPPPQANRKLLIGILVGVGLAVAAISLGASRLLAAPTQPVESALAIPPPPATVFTPIAKIEPIVPEPLPPVAEVVKPPPVVKPVTAERAPGPLRVEELIATVTRSQGKLLKCFTRFPEQLTERVGEVKITLSIDPAGVVTATKASVPPGPLADCITAGAKALRFPKHSGPPVTVNVPFAYRAE